MPTVMNLIFLALIVVALILIVISLVLRKKSKNIEKINLEQFDDIYQKRERLIKTIDEADDAIDQLNSLSKDIFEEQEQKYQELLYLYQIIDDKKRELSEIWEKTDPVFDNHIQIEKTADEALDDIHDTENKDMEDVEQFALNSFSINNPKYSEIIDLYDRGNTVTDIAKQLDIGQGEVSLILKLKKRGDKSKYGQ